jgi:hypothetical protein
MGEIRPPSSDRDSISSKTVDVDHHVTKNELHTHDGQQQQALDSEQQIEMRTSSDLNSATDYDNES